MAAARMAQADKKRRSVTFEDLVTDRTNAEYARARRRSEALFKRQQAVVPGGITHRSRYREPFPLFVSGCTGAYKKDVDGHRYIDYWMGHGALLFGNADPAVVKAVHDQAGRGFHAGGETEIGLGYRRVVCTLPLDPTGRAAAAS